MTDPAAPPPANPSRVSPKTVDKAISALVKWRESKSQTSKPQLLENDEFLYLIVSLNKIPQKGRTNPHKVPLPHPIIDPVADSLELCLIVDDRPKSNLTKDVAAKKIKSENIPVSKIIKFSKLRTDYRPFEAKRKLCDSYDMFFADRRIIPLLPRLLGKQFFRKKKIPVAIDLKHKNWKEQMEKACGAGLFYVRTGTCSVVKVGKMSMGRKEIAENVMAAVNGIAEIFPSKWKNIRSFHLKLFESLALPVYQSLPDLKLKIDVSTKRNNDVEEEKEEELAKSDVSVENKSDGENVSVMKKKKKGRIHEVRYMDSNVSEMLDEDEIGVGDEDEIVGGKDSNNEEMGVDESGDKKRKKLDKAKGEKPAKKAAKVKKAEALKEKVKRKDGLKPKTQKKGGEESGGLKEQPKKKRAIKN